MTSNQDRRPRKVLLPAPSQSLRKREKRKMYIKIVEHEIYINYTGRVRKLPQN